MSTEPSEPSARAERGPGQSPGQPRSRRRASVLGTGWILVAILAVVALAVARPLYRQLETWRASTLVSQAGELAAQHLYTDAIMRYQTALRLDPSQMGALRGLAEIYSLFEKPAAIPAWRALLAHPNRTEQDTLDFIGFTLKAQRFDLAEAELARLLAGTNISIPTLVVAAELFQRQGNPRRALDFAEDIARRQPENPDHPIRVARYLLGHAGPRETARRVPSGSPSCLRFLPPDRLSVFQTLETAPSLPEPETSAFLDRLPALQAPSAADRLGQTDVRLRLTSDRWQSPRAVGPGGAEIRCATAHRRNNWRLCRWLVRSREHKPSCCGSYSLADATALPPILTTYLDALGQAERWEELQQAASQPLPVDAWILAAFRSGAAARLKQETLAQEHWRRALEAAHREPSRIQALGDIALRLGTRQRAIEAYNLLANDDLHRTAGYRRLARLHEEARDTESLRLLMREWAANAPDDPAPTARYAYLCALVRRNLDDAHARVLPLVERFPARAAYRSTLAFIEWRQDQLQAGVPTARSRPHRPGHLASVPTDPGFDPGRQRPDRDRPRHRTHPPTGVFAA
jgi:tetratricopeptide (TPR) repeat protein